MPVPTNRSSGAAALALVALALAVAAPRPSSAVTTGLDPAFGTGGTLGIAISSASGADEAFAVTLDEDDNVVAAGYATNPHQQMAVVRLTHDGSLDPTFNGTGVVRLDLGARARAQALVIQPDDGKIVVAGYAVPSGTELFAVARLLPNGAPDEDFGNHGIVTTPFGIRDARAAAVALQDDGSIVVAGWSRSATNRDIALVRYTSAGVPDPSFGVGGKVTIGIGAANDEATAVALQTDQKIVITGYASDGTGSDVLVARFTSTGILDVDFNGSGYRRLSPGGGVEQGNALLVQPDDRILIGGQTKVGSTARFAAARVNANGSLDPGFNGSGMTTTAIGELAEGKSIALTTRGRFLIAGRAQLPGGKLQFVVARYLADGTLDPTFGTAGVELIALGTKSDEGYGVAVDTDGSITVAGNTRVGSNTNFGFARLLVFNCTDGFLDAGEDCDGGASPSCCSSTCTIQPVDTVCRPVADACDIAESCDGIVGTCPADEMLPDGDLDGVCDEQDDCPLTSDPDQRDGDGDGLGDSCDPCTNGVEVQSVSVRFVGLQSPGGDDSIKILGTVSLPGSTVLSPTTDGARVLIHAADGSLLFDVAIPPGEFDTQTKVGWQTSSNGRKSLFHSPVLVDGLVRRFRMIRALTPGRYHLKIVGSSLDFSQLPLFGAMELTLVVDPPLAAEGRCGEITFAAPHACNLSDDQNALVCK